MKKIIENILLVFMGSVITFVSSSIFNYLTFERGSISIGSPLNVNGSLYLPLQIRNYENKTLPNIEMLTPHSAELANIISSFPLAIKEISSDIAPVNSKIFSISGIHEKNTIDLMIPIASPDMANDVIILNALENNIAYLKKDSNENPLYTSLVRSLISSITTAVILSFLAYYIYRMKEHIDNRLNYLQKEVEAREKRNDYLQERLDATEKEIVTKYRKIQIYLVARISDYEKELSFWRDAIRNILYSIGEDKNSATKFLTKITTSLKTYGTLHMHDEYGLSAVLAMVDTFIQSDKKTSTPE